MGAAEPPYIYEPMPGARRSVAYPYSDFNPRAATQAHYTTLAERAERQRRRNAQDGKPLINFNQHPDSYMIVSQQNVSFEPLPSNTKRIVTNMRWVQLALRCVEEIIAIGLMVCVICLRMDLNSVGWISRIAPAWDILVTMYAIYHLVRPAKARTPATSASYHFFALFIDTSLIPFYIFMALCADQNWVEVTGTDGRWTSFFSSDQATSELILLTFIGSAVMAGLHFISIAVDFYLIVMFRRIARLPPDMNPLEDNLTSRRPRSVRHKHKNSEATLVSDSAEPMSEKREHYLSGSTLALDHLSRVSTAKEPETRTMPFGHSRMNSDTSFSPHNPDTARWSRQQFDDARLHGGQQTFSQTRSDRQSDRYSHAEPSSPSKRGSFAEDPQEQHLSSRLGSHMNRSTKSHQQYFTPTLPNVTQSNTAARSQQKEHLLNDNWYVLGDDDGANDLGTAQFHNHQTSAYAQVPKEIPHHERHDSFNPQPLRMNPPTPPLAADNDDDDDDLRNFHRDPANPGTSHVARGLTVASHKTHSSSIYSESVDAPSPQSTSPPKTRTPKGKYYGDLAAATRGVRGGYGIAPPTPETSRSPSPAKDHKATKTRKGQDQDRDRDRNRNETSSPRVVSRTGADIGDASAAYAPGQGPWAGMRGRREVSGKEAEEGRVGGWRRMG